MNQHQIFKLSKFDNFSTLIMADMIFFPTGPLTKAVGSVSV